MTIPATIPQDECSRASVTAATEPSLEYRDDEDDELSRDITPAAGKRRWSEQARTKHSQACKANGRLTLAEKLEIIRLYESCDHQERKSQKELAVMYGKSRMTISTTLRPDNVRRYRQLGESGVRLEAKRCKRNDHWNLERCAFEAIGNQVPTTTDEMARVVETIALSHGLSDIASFGEFLRTVCCVVQAFGCCNFIARLGLCATEGSARFNTCNAGGLKKANTD
jgi:transposase-like protein